MQVSTTDASIFFLISLGKCHAVCHTCFYRDLILADDAIKLPTRSNATFLIKSQKKKCEIENVYCSRKLKRLGRGFDTPKHIIKRKIKEGKKVDHMCV